MLNIACNEFFPQPVPFSIFKAPNSDFINSKSFTQAAITYSPLGCHLKSNIFALVPFPYASNPFFLPVALEASFEASIKVLTS